MPTETRLADLLLRWEDLRRHGQTVAAEQLCRGCPELLGELKRRIEALAALDPLLKTTPPSDPETLRAPAPLVGTLRPPTFDPPSSFEKEPAAGAEYAPLKANFQGFGAGSEPLPGYRLVERLGRGGFGEVWKAIAPGGFSVALKLVPLHEKVGATELHSLEIVKGLRHPNLLMAFGAWQREGMLIVAMELADRTLWDRYQEARNGGAPGIPHQELLEYLREAAKGIDYLNEPHHVLAGKERVSIQHRDIKPQNILLVGSGVKVADFGLVRLLEHALTSHSGSMTPAYAAPEFLRGQTASQSDQYCLAVTYCEVRGGRLPFAGTHAQIMHGHLMEPPDLTMLPEQERRVVARALAKEPSDRWPSCRAFVEALAASMHASSRGKTGASRPAAGGGRRLSRWLALPALAGAVIAAAVYLPPLVPTGREEISQERADVPEPQAAETPTVSPQSTTEPTPDPAGPENKQATSVEPSLAELQPEATQAKTHEPQEPAKPSERSTLDPQPSTLPAPGEMAPAKSSEAIVTATADAKPVERLKPSEASLPQPPPQPFSELRRFAEHRGGVRSVAVSPAGRYVLSAGDDRAIWLWDIDTGQGIHRFDGHTDVVNCVAFSPDGRLAMSGGDDKTVRLWNVATQTALPAFEGHTDAVYAAAFSPDGLRAISAGNDSTVRVWNVEQQNELNHFGLDGEAIWSLAISPANRYALTASDSNLVRLWDVGLGVEVHRFMGHRDVAGSVAVSPDGRLALSGGGLSDGSRDYDLRLWDIEQRTMLRTLKGHIGAVGSVAFSPDGRRALSGGLDMTVRLWDVETGNELHCIKDHADVIYWVTFSHDGHRALSASRDGTVRVWGLPQ